MKFSIILSVLFAVFSINLLAEPEIEEVLSEKCGTFSPSLIQKLKNKYPASLEDNSRPQDALFSEKYISPSGKFMVHYAVSGKDKVNLEDMNKNGIPDYVDSVAYYFDFAYQKEVVEFGFKAPPSDGTLSGGDGLYDVYLEDLGNEENTYGYTVPENPTPKTGAFQPYYSYITLDNDYSSEDYIIKDGRKVFPYSTTSGINALRITAVHEYFHAVQFGIGVPNNVDYQSFMEMNATFMEYRLFPEVLDYLQYVRKLFKDISIYSFGNSYYENGYKWSIFFQMTYKKYGNSFLKEVWDRINFGLNPYKALDTELNKYNSSIYNELEDIVLWIYYSNVNAKNENNYFDKAAEYPLMSFTYEEAYSEPSAMITSYLEPLAIYPFRVRFIPETLATSPDTLIGFVINKDLENTYTQSMNNKKATEVIITNISNLESCSHSIINNKYCIEKNYSDSELSLVLIEKLGSDIINEELVFPNPLLLGEDEYISFPIDYTTKIGAKAELTVYNTENYKIYNNTIEVGVNENHKSITWRDFPEDFSTGVYFYSIVIDDHKTYGKFAVKNKK